MKQVELVLVLADDWQGIYLDGILELEGHTIMLDDVLNIVNINNVKYGGLFHVEQNWIEIEGSLPANLNNVQLR